MPAGVIGPRGRITLILVTSYTLSDQDNRNTLVFDNASAITVTIPQGLQIGWNANIIQQGAGAISFATATGVTLNNLNGASGISGQYAEGTLKAVNTNVFDLSVVTASTAAVAPTVRTVSDTTDTILITDLGNAVSYTSGSAVAVTVPSGLGAGFTCLILQAGAGTVTVGAGAGATVVNRQSQFDTAGQWAQCSLFADAADHFVFGGDTA